MDFLKSTIKQTIITAVIYVGLGVFFIMKPDTSFDIISKILAIAILVIGLVQIALYFTERNFMGIQRNGLTSGLVISIFAIFLLAKPDFAQSLVGYALAFAIILAGIMQFQNALDLQHFKQSEWGLLLIAGLIEIVLGVVALIDPFGADKTLIFAIGIFLCICAAFKIISSIFVGKGIHGLKSAAKEASAVDVTDTAKVSNENDDIFSRSAADTSDTTKAESTPGTSEAADKTDAAGSSDTAK